MEGRSDTFFENTVISFSLRDMRLSWAVGHVNLWFVFDSIHYWFEFVVGMDLINSKTIMVAWPKNGVEAIGWSVVRPGLEELCRPVVESSGDGREERHLIDKHNVHA